MRFVKLHMAGFFTAKHPPESALCLPLSDACLETPIPIAFQASIFGGSNIFAIPGNAELHAKVFGVAVQAAAV